jgi:hypothetical protein
MKRKSILMTIVALLFASVAIGQTGPWPTAAKATAAAGVDTVYFCEHKDSLYPLELGYDGLGLNLHPSYGDWFLLATSNENVAADYDVRISDTERGGNGGAGNAFKTTGTKYGGYVFAYKAKEIQCGLAVNDTFLVFVFVLPDENLPIKKDTLICKQTAVDSIPISFANSFKPYIDLYKTSGIIPANATLTWNQKGSQKLRVNQVGQETLIDTLVIASATAPKEYTCGYQIRFRFEATIVDQIGQLESKNESRCAEDSVRYADSNPNVIFNRNSIAGGFYTPSQIKDAPSVNGLNGIKKKGFTFTYPECGAGGNKTVQDTLYLIPDKEPGEVALNWDRDTVTVCRRPGTKSIYDFYNDPEINYPKILATHGLVKPDLDPTNSSWYDRGTSGTDGALTGVYGTKTNVTSLVDGVDVLIPELRSNAGYNYLWVPDAGAFPCLVDDDGKIDTGYIVVVITDEAIAQDYTAQLCQPTYAGKKFSLAEYTGLTGLTTWDGPGVVNNDSIDISTVAEGTHKYTYELGAGCGPGGKGVFYIKVGKRVKIASSKTVRYCKDNLPARINLNDVLNIAVQEIEWEYVSGTVNNVALVAPPTGFTKDGLFNILEYNGAHTGEATLTFKIKTVPAGSCVNVDATLTLVFASVI